MKIYRIAAIDLPNYGKTVKLGFWFAVSLLGIQPGILIDMSSPKFLIFRNASAGDYFYHLVSADGEVVLQSEGYTKQGCLKAISAVKQNAGFDSRYDRWDGIISYSFKLKSGNWVIIGRGEDYTSAVARERAIIAVKRDAPKALIIEMT